MTERLPAICTPEDIKAAYRPGLRIVWEEGGLQEVWEIVAVDEEMATTRFIQTDGSQLDRTARFDDLSSHSSFPVGTELTKEDFETPAGRFHGTHAIATTPGGEQHFYFSDDHPGPPMKIQSAGVVRQQVGRSDL